MKRGNKPSLFQLKKNKKEDVFRYNSLFLQK